MVEKEQISRPNVANFRTYLFCPTDYLVPQDGADLLRQVPRHQIARANAAGGCSYEDFFGTLQHRSRGCNDFQPIGAHDQRLPHAVGMAGGDH
jgi:hypothetical protein